MKYIRYIALLIAMAWCCVAASAFPVYAGDHIKELDAVRSLMHDMGYKLPDMIKSAEPKNMRTYERVFEINNYSLAIIESYLKMLKVATISGGSINKDIISIVNGWLKFMTSCCEHDISFLNEVLAGTKDPAVVKVVTAERDLVERLKKIALQGIEENTKLVTGMQR